MCMGECLRVGGYACVHAHMWICMHSHVYVYVHVGVVHAFLCVCGGGVHSHVSMHVCVSLRIIP